MAQEVTIRKIANAMNPRLLKSIFELENMSRGIHAAIEASTSPQKRRASSALQSRSPGKKIRTSSHDVMSDEPRGFSLQPGARTQDSGSEENYQVTNVADSSPDLNQSVVYGKEKAKKEKKTTGNANASRQSTTTTTPSAIEVARLGLTGKALSDAINQAARHPRPPSNYRSERVINDRLDICQVTTGIAAITEAVHRQTENNMPFTLISSTILHKAKLQTGDSMAQGIRPKSYLIFPWVHNEAELKHISSYHVDNYHIARTKSTRSAHIFLVRVHQDVGPLSLPQLEFFDSVPDFWKGKDRQKLYQLMKSHVRRTVTNFGVLGPPPLINGTRLAGASIPFETPEIITPVATQIENWECGLHTILNAWALALNLSINPKCELEPEQLDEVVNFVNLVLDGNANCAMVVGFLKSIKWVEHTSREDQRYFLGYLRDIHNITSTGRLNDSIIPEREEEERKLDWIIKMQRHEEGGPKPLEFVANIKPNDRPTEREPLVSPSTIGHFFLDKENGFPAAQSSLRIAWDMLVTEERVDQSGKPTQNSLDMFRRRFLTHFGVLDSDGEAISVPESETIAEREVRFKSVIAKLKRKYDNDEELEE